MPTLNDAAKQSQIPMTVASFRSIVTSDELFPMLEFVPKGGESFSYTREKSIGSFGFIADNYGGNIASSSATDEKVTVPKRQAVEDFEIEHFDMSNQADLINPMDYQTVKKFKAAGRLLANKFINGRNNTGFTIQAFQSGNYVDAVSAGPWIDSNRHGPGDIKYTHTGTLVQFRAPGDTTYGPAVEAAADGDYLLKSDNPSKWIVVTLDVTDATADATRQILFSSSTNEFDGLKVLISSGQTRTSSGANGDPVTFSLLDQLIDSVKENSDRMAFMMHSTLRQKVASLMRATPHALPPITLPGDRRQVPVYNGIPILKNDWITKDEAKGSATTLSSIYLVNLSPENGVYMGALGGQRFDVEGDPRNTNVLGFQVIDLGAIQKGSGNKVGRRLVWYGAPAVGSDLSVARATEIITE